MKAPWRKHPARLERQLTEADLESAMGRVQADPPSIHNPDGGTRYHFLDPDTGRPVCKASGSSWTAGDGGLRLCGLCRDMRAPRQAASS